MIIDLELLPLLFVVLLNVSIFFVVALNLLEKYKKNKKIDFNNLIFCVYICFLIIWSICNYLVDEEIAGHSSYLFLKFDFIFALAMAITLSIFSYVFQQKNIITNTAIIKRCFFSSIPLLLLSYLIMWGGLIEKIMFSNDGRIVDIIYNNSYYYLYNFVLVVFLAWTIKNFYTNFKSANSIQRRQFLFITFGILLMTFSLIAANIFLPYFIDKTSVYWKHLSRTGIYSMMFFIVCTAYAITKHHLFNLKLITTEIIVIVVNIFTFVQIFTSVSMQDLYLKIFFFAAFFILSFLLLKSVFKEVYQREQIEILNKELKIKNKYLDDLVKMKSEFLHVTSHQLKTPISIIRGYLSMIIDGDYKGTKKDEAIIKVMQATNRLGDTVRDFLDASDLEGENIYFKLEPVNIHDILKETISDKQMLIKNKNLQIIMAEPHEEIPLISTSKDRIIDVFSNLIDNAIYYTPQGSITISFILKGKTVIVEIKDTGIGISKEESGKLFEKFSRSSRSKLLRPDGSGLGLFIARKIVINCGGKIWFHSDGQGAGTSFFVELPIYNDKKI